MQEIIQVLKDEHNERPIPTIWRNTFVEMVEALKQQNFDLLRSIGGVRPFSIDDATRMTRNIQRYGAQLSSLPEASWQTSVCQWMDGYWAVLVDLYTIEEGASDLTLSLRVYEDGSTYAFDYLAVYVP